ncbi:hypothetical protein JK358_34270 [Nocardia sp. 2]|uniref:Uncharacterized protein n=1 Tax=Nocardia acididurans TaxID=2802282 RepID=A0ABS1MFX1_9NOCA|nr:RRQRL motif-containing zinc-binding protein [Nocardia acididurans]MBL1079484.1 hypothetical protein [Nocardia acididurans]
MTTTDPQDEVPAGGIPIYPWRMAPAHLRTRRQLAAQGLRTNGQDIAGTLPPGRWGKTTYLYDVRLAAPKRPCTAAHRTALAKATRERQLRAAERHGIDRTEFEHDTDPGWDTAPQPPARPVNAFAAAAAREALDAERGWER